MPDQIYPQKKANKKKKEINYVGIWIRRRILWILSKVRKISKNISKNISFKKNLFKVIKSDFYKICWLWKKISNGEIFNFTYYFENLLNYKRKKNENKYKQIINKFGENL